MKCLEFLLLLQFINDRFVVAFISLITLIVQRRVMLEVMMWFP